MRADVELTLIDRRNRKRALEEVFSEIPSGLGCATILVCRVLERPPGVLYAHGR